MTIDSGLLSFGRGGAPRMSKLWMWYSFQGCLLKQKLSGHLSSSSSGGSSNFLKRGWRKTVYQATRRTLSQMHTTNYILYWKMGLIEKKSESMGGAVAPPSTSWIRHWLRVDCQHNGPVLVIRSSLVFTLSQTEQSTSVPQHFPAFCIYVISRCGRESLKTNA